MKIFPTLLALMVFSTTVSAKELLVGVPLSNWLPVSYEEKGELKGADIEIIKSIFALNQIGVRFKRMPFPRLLEEMKSKKIDAMAANLKEERKAFMFFPEEPLNYEENHLAVPVDFPLNFTGKLTDLEGLTIGVVKGWSDGGMFDQAKIFEKVVLNNQKNLVKNIALGRLDAGVGTRFDLLDRAEKLGVKSKIRIEPVPILRTPYYLAFSKKNGHEKLSHKISKTLETFKKSPKHMSIFKKYGLAIE